MLKRQAGVEGGLLPVDEKRLGSMLDCVASMRKSRGSTKFQLTISRLFPLLPISAKGLAIRWRFRPLSCGENKVSWPEEGGHEAGRADWLGVRKPIEMGPECAGDRGTTRAPATPPGGGRPNKAMLPGALAVAISNDVSGVSEQCDSINLQQ